MIYQTSEVTLERQLDELDIVEVLDFDPDYTPYVEIVMTVNRSGDAGEFFVMEWFPVVPNKYEKSLPPSNVRVFTMDVFSRSEQKKYELFGALVGRIAYHGH